MLKFHCGHCDKKMGVPDDYAGKQVRCMQCSETIVVPPPSLDDTAPAMEAINPDSSESAWTDEMFYQPEESDLQQHDLVSQCPECGSHVDEGVVICVQCGHNFSDGANLSTLTEKTRSKNKAGRGTQSKPMQHSLGGFSGTDAGDASMSRLPLALGTSLVASAIGGAVWCAIIYFTNYQLGIIAWGIGLLAGGGAVVFTPERTKRLGLIAAGTALIGLLFGKILIIQIMGVQELTQMFAEDPPQEMVSAWADDPDTLYQIACKNLRDAGEFDELLAEQAQEVFFLIDDLPADVLAARDKAITLSESWDGDEREQEVRAFIAKNADKIAKSFIREYPLVDQIKDSMELFDLLWFFLAISSAFGIASGARGQEG